MLQTTSSFLNGSTILAVQGAFILGAIVGSFINVVVYRLPIMLKKNWHKQSLEMIAEIIGNNHSVPESIPKPDETPFNLMTPNSECPHCSTNIKPWHNIPIAGYFFLRGKCALCKHSISKRYPLVEAATAFLTAFVILILGPNLHGLAGCFLLWALTALSLIDFDTQLLPDDITLPFLWVGLIANYFNLLTSFGNAFWGACAGYCSLWAIFQFFKLITGKESMGYGDFKLLAMLGAWLGIQMVPLIIFLSSCAGAIVGGAMILFGHDKTSPIAFGPFLAAAGLISLLFGNELINLYLLFSFRA